MSGGVLNQVEMTHHHTKDSHAANRWVSQIQNWRKVLYPAFDNNL